MVSKNKDKGGKGKDTAESKEQKSGRLKVLNLNKETVKDLTKKEQRGIAGASLGTMTLIEPTESRS